MFCNFPYGNYNSEKYNACQCFDYNGGKVTMINERVSAELPRIIASSIFIWHISDRSNSALNSASIDSTKCGPRAKNNTILRKKSESDRKKAVSHGAWIQG